jgi:hypothetical protein
MNVFSVHLKMVYSLESEGKRVILSQMYPLRAKTAMVPLTKRLVYGALGKGIKKWFFCLWDLMIK